MTKKELFEFISSSVYVCADTYTDGRNKMEDRIYCKSGQFYLIKYCNSHPTCDPKPVNKRTFVIKKEVTAYEDENGLGIHIEREIPE